MADRTDPYRAIGARESTSQAARPTLTVIAGPEGAGKSTFIEQMRSNSKVPEALRPPVFSGDKVQSDLLKHQGPRGYGAGNLIAQVQTREHLQTGRSAIYETSFSDRNDVGLLKDAQAQGYRVNLVHLQTNSPSLSVARVEARAAEGGREVPERIVRADYQRSGAFIREAAQTADRTYVFDSSALNQEPRHQLSLNRGRVVETGRDLQPWVGQTYGTEITASQANDQAVQRTAPPATPQRARAEAAQVSAKESFDRTVGIAQRIEPGARVDIAGYKPGEYRGTIVGATKHHVLQQNGPQQFTAHFKERIAVTPDERLGADRNIQGSVVRSDQKPQDVTFTYAGDRSRASVTYNQPERAPLTADQRKAEAREFVNQTGYPEQRTDPRFAAANAAAQKLDHVQQAALPYDENVERAVNNQIAQSLAHKIADGKPITISDQLVKTVNYQVARQSVKAMDEAKQLNPNPTITVNGKTSPAPYTVEPKHRDLLVNRSESMMRAVTANPASLRSPERTEREAHSIAGALGRLDGGKREPPFNERALAESYKAGQQGRDSLAQQMAKGKEIGGR
jgi:predicted ABC-type ATPase